MEEVSKKKITLLEFIIAFLIGCMIGWFILRFVFTTFYVSGDSMLPTFCDGQQLYLNQTTRITGDYKRGDVIVIDTGNDYHRYLVKRIIGLPEDTISISDGYVYINEEVLVEPYIDCETNTFNTEKYCDVIILGEDEYYVLGDNRINSLDSRVFGPIEEHSIVGKVIY